MALQSPRPHLPLKKRPNKGFSATVWRTDWEMRLRAEVRKPFRRQTVIAGARQDKVGLRPGSGSGVYRRGWLRCVPLYRG